MITRILIIQTASLGDVILSTSLAETLHEQYPGASIDYLVKNGYQGLFKGHPFINKVLVWDKNNRKYLNLLGLIIKVRGNKYDIVINVQRFASSGLITALSGAKYTAGFTKNPFSFAYTVKADHVIKNEPGSPHEINRNYKLIQPLTGLRAAMPRLYPSEEDKASVSQYQSVQYITISPASLYFTKQLIFHKWIELINNINSSFRVVLLGSKDDLQLCQKIMESSSNENVICLAGELSFLQSVALMGKAVMNYVNDSAPLHFTSAIDAPVAAIFCSTVPAFGFGPLSSNSTTIETEVPLSCKPCGLHGYMQCPLGHFKCAQTITLQQMLLPITHGQRD